MHPYLRASARTTTPHATNHAGCDQAAQPSWPPRNPHLCRLTPGSSTTTLRVGFKPALRTPSARSQTRAVRGRQLPPLKSFSSSASRAPSLTVTSPAGAMPTQRSGPRTNPEIRTVILGDAMSANGICSGGSGFRSGLSWPPPDGFSSAAGVVGGIVVAYVAEAVFSYRKPVNRGPVRATEAEIAAARAEARRAARRWETEAVPSPGGWRPPPGSRPAWQWTPPDGLRARLERVPAWVRLWYKTPLVDRYACTWMWHHGGWDVLPPTRKSQP